MLVRFRKRLARALAGAQKCATTMALLGCDKHLLKKHIEAQFLPGMSWSNRSEWHIDHKRPCKSFNLLDPAQQRVCFHYTNLQPLWAVDNIRKSAKWSPEAADQTASIRP